jgi:hypothetical protein
VVELVRVIKLEQTEMVELAVVELEREFQEQPIRALAQVDVLTVLEAVLVALE